MLETPVFSTAAVAAPHARAAELGQTILASGGNAIEAVVAMAATCAVVLPHSNGLGGDGFFLVREPRGRVHAIDASGPAGALATIQRYRTREHEILPAHGPDAAITVAGVVAGWALALDLSKALGGGLPLGMLLSDAIRIAREGSVVSLSESRVPIDAALREAPNFAATFLADGHPAEAGSIRRQPKLADTLERLAHAGLADFYRGDVGREIALDLERLDTPIVRRDVETYRARVVTALSIRLEQAEIFNLPAPSEGIASLLALGIADRLATRARETTDAYHLSVEAFKRALVSGAPFITDPREIEGDPAAFLEGPHCGREALQIDRHRAASIRLPRATGGTQVWIGCIDKDGLAVSYAQSICGAFGSGCVLPTTGLLWHNTGTVFSLDPAARNPLMPGRKPPHRLNPALALLSDHRVLAYGGDTQVQAQIFSRYADYGSGLADAVDAPRWLLAQDREGSAVLRVEERLDPGMLRGLAQRGHLVEEIGRPYADMMGHAGMIVRHPRNGRVEATHDPRGDGDAMGL
jgi:gamma-glutamyltranspeptidase/glutathione hydrolase